MLLMVRHEYLWQKVTFPFMNVYAAYDNASNVTAKNTAEEGISIGALDTYDSKFICIFSNDTVSCVTSVTKHQ